MTKEKGNDSGKEESIKAVEREYFVPEYQLTVKATSLEAATKKAKAMKQEEK